MATFNICHTAVQLSFKLGILYLTEDGCIVGFIDLKSFEARFGKALAEAYPREYK